MGAPLFLRKNLRGQLEPVDEAGVEALSHYKAGDVVRGDLRKPRNPRRHRWYWALCGLVAENSERTAEEVSTLLKLATGHRDTLPLKAGACPHCGGEVAKVAYLPKSISFAKMDDVQFAAFVDRCVHVVVTRLLPGVEAPILKAEIEAMLS